MILTKLNDSKLLYRIVKWYFNIYFLNKTYPLICIFSLTHNCNLKCRLCNLGPSKIRKTIPLNLFKNAIDDLGKMGTYYLQITGGEPFMVKNIVDYIIYAKRKIPFVQVTTNGCFIDERMAKLINDVKLDMIYISIDGLEKPHDKNRGKGTFKKAIKAIKYIKKFAPRTEIIVNTMLAPWNIDDQVVLRDICKKLGVKQRYLATIYYPEIRNKISKEYICVSLDKIKKIDSFIENHIRNDKINKKNYLKLFVQYYESLILNKKFIIQHPILKQDCLLPYFFVTINEKGFVYPCDGLLNRNKYSLYKYRFRRIISSEEWLKDINGLKKCKKCDNDPVTCYLQPRLNFPISNFIRYSLLSD